MNDRIWRLNTCPGTSTGKPGGYGVTKVAETTSTPASSFSSISSSVRYSQWVSL